MNTLPVYVTFDRANRFANNLELGPIHVNHQRHRPVVHQSHLHIRAKHSRLRFHVKVPKREYKSVKEALAILKSCALRKAGATALSLITVHRKV
jgi:hypothetical protein